MVSLLTMLASLAIKAIITPAALVWCMVDRMFYLPVAQKHDIMERHAKCKGTKDGQQQLACWA